MSGAEMEQQPDAKGVHEYAAPEKPFIPFKLLDTEAGSENGYGAADGEGVENVATRGGGEGSCNEEVGEEVGLDREEEGHKVEEGEDAGADDGGVCECAAGDEGGWGEAGGGFPEGEDEEEETADYWIVLVKFGEWEEKRTHGDDDAGLAPVFFATTGDC